MRSRPGRTTRRRLRLQRRDRRQRRRRLRGRLRPGRAPPNPPARATQAGTSFTGSSSPDGDDWWIHVRAVDAAGNCGDAVHFGPFWIDTVAPGAVSGLASTDHAVGLPSIDPTLAIAWTAATDDALGRRRLLGAVRFERRRPAATETEETSSTSFASAGARSRRVVRPRLRPATRRGTGERWSRPAPTRSTWWRRRSCRSPRRRRRPTACSPKARWWAWRSTELRLTFDERMSTAAGLATSYRSDLRRRRRFPDRRRAPAASRRRIWRSRSARPRSTAPARSRPSPSTAASRCRPAATVSTPARRSPTPQATISTATATGRRDDDFVRGFTVDRSPPQVTLVDSLAATAGAGVDRGRADERGDHAARRSPSASRSTTRSVTRTRRRHQPGQLPPAGLRRRRLPDGVVPGGDRCRRRRGRHRRGDLRRADAASRRSRSTAASRWARSATGSWSAVPRRSSISAGCRSTATPTAPAATTSRARSRSTPRRRRIRSSRRACRPASGSPRTVSR